MNSSSWHTYICSVEELWMLLPYHLFINHYYFLFLVKCLLSKGKSRSTFVLWALDWGWIKQTLNSHQPHPETEVSFSLYKSLFIKEAGSAAQVLSLANQHSSYPSNTTQLKLLYFFQISFLLCPPNLQKRAHQQ